jgi:hypothetical protein
LVRYVDEIVGDHDMLGIVVPDPPQYKRPKTIFVEEQTVYVKWNNFNMPVSEWVEHLEVLGEVK